MIPKIIHYCWLSGDPFPPLIQQCIDSWKQKLPDYQFMLWDTNQIDVNSNDWLKESFANKKYAFAADYIRFYALYHYGGIYLDADVEVLKSFDPLTEQNEFLGEDASGDIEAAVIGVEKGCSWVKECLDYYKDRHFVLPNGKFDMSPVPLLVRRVINRHPNIKIYPYTYFSPKDYNIGKIAANEDTFCIHHYDGKWIRKGLKYKTKILLHKCLYYTVGREKHNQFVHFIRKFK